MTRVNFYILQQSEVVDRHHFVCRLAQKAVNEGNRVLIATGSEAESSTLDHLLWQFKPESFIPHATVNAADTHLAPVLLSHTDDATDHHDLLINLRSDIPPTFSRFKTLAEIVIQQPAVLESTRHNWKFYKDRGYELNSYKL